jgi:UDP-glucose 4-epimerase
MKVLVTGSAGFVGSHVADVLREEGHDVIGLDVRESPLHPVVKADLLQPNTLIRALEGMDAVCHLAAVGDTYLAFDNPPLAAAINVAGTANLIEACCKNGLKKFVYASTWEVYGEPHYQPIDEEHPCKPDHPYNITKLAGEQMALSYDHLKGLPVISLRLGTAYGSRMRPNAVFSIFIRKARAGEPLVIQGTGEQTRQFTHARDIGRAFHLALVSRLRDQVVNIVSNESISIRQLAELVCSRLSTSINYEPARAGDIAPARISSEKARRLLAWEPQVPFVEGLYSMIDSESRQ